jgi:hypothetical protein
LVASDYSIIKFINLLGSKIISNVLDNTTASIFRVEKYMGSHPRMA